MYVLKCKMCGGTLNIENERIAVCEYCGAQQTIPKLDDERIVTMYDRANHYRRNNEYDKAMNLYEQILLEDSTDSEAYWSIILCRYGIEYVEDPASRKYIPTINRAQFASVLADEDYKSAIKHATIEQKILYEQEAKTIDEIQKGILSISRKEEPFDIFICYKETDNNGRRTRDSVLANDLYHQLTREGYKVFFSRITLEDKLGEAYEPYIFAALQSSKIMIVLGTKPEYFDAVWVKNEWSRYLALIKKGENKTLVPAYKDMDPYDLPEAFSHLQAQDMSQLGFMQDLLRGVKKLIGNSSKEEKTSQINNNKSNNTNITYQENIDAMALLDRAYIELSFGEWNKASTLLDKVLDADPRNAKAYIGQLLAAEKKSSLQEYFKSFIIPDFSNVIENALISQNKSFTHPKVSGKASYISMSFDDDAHVEKMIKQYSLSEGYMPPDYIRTQYLHDVWGYYSLTPNMKEKRIEIPRSIEQNNYLLRASTFANEELKKELVEGKNTIKEHLDHLVACSEKHDIEKQERIKNRHDEFIEKVDERVVNQYQVALDDIYLKATSFFEDESNPNYQIKLLDAIQLFEVIPEYKDSKNKIEQCKERITDIEYQKALACLERKTISKLKEAEEIYDNIGDYKDIVSRINEQKDYYYSEILSLLRTNKLEDLKKAEDKYIELGDYRDLNQKITECKESFYREAESYLMTEDRELIGKGKNIYKMLENYKDSSHKVSACGKRIDEITQQIRSQSRAIEKQEFEKRQKKQKLKDRIFAFIAVLVFILIVVALIGAEFGGSKSRRVNRDDSEALVQQYRNAHKDDWFDNDD